MTRRPDHKGDRRGKNELVKPPGRGEAVMAAEAETEALAGAEATRLSAVAARANYLSGDRPDIQYAVKEICRRMGKLVKGFWEKLIRMGR